MHRKLALFFSFRISLTEWFEKGILEREVKVYNLLSSRFDEITFFTYGGSQDRDFQSYLAPNIRIVPIPFLRKGGPAKRYLPLMIIYSLIMPLVHWRKIISLDIIKTNQLPGAWTAALAKLLFWKKFILRCGYIWSFNCRQNGEGFLRVGLKRLLEKFSCWVSDRIVVASENDISRLTSSEKTKKKISVVPNYIDTDLFKPIPGSKIKNSICYVGRMEKEKNISMLIEAIEGTQMNLTIFGSGSLKSSLEKEASQKGVSVEFVDNIPNSDLPQRLNQFELFALLSNYEGTPKALLEAMSCGLSVVGSNVGGINNIVQHDNNGLLCERTPESVRQSLETLNKDENLRIRLGNVARETVIKRFALSRVVEKEYQLYESVN